MIIPNEFANVAIALIYLIPLVILLLVLRAFFRAAKAVEECAAAQKEQTELLRRLASTMDGLEIETTAADAACETTGKRQ